MQVDASYTLPLTARDLTLNLRYRRNDYSVSEEPFDPLDGQSDSEVFSVTLRQPFYRTLRREFAVVLTAEHLYNATFRLRCPEMLARRDTWSKAARVRRPSPLQAIENQS